MPRKKLLILALVITFLIWGLFQFLSANIGIAFTIKGQQCFPYRIWLIRKGVLPGYGEYVAFKNPNVDGRATWIKLVSGKEGDWLEVHEFLHGQRFTVFVDDLGKELMVRGVVFLHSANPLNGSERFEAFQKDSKGNELPLVREGKISKGKYFVTSPSVRSFDSRYWGLVDEGDIIGKAYPIF